MEETPEISDDAALLTFSPTAMRRFANADKPADTIIICGSRKWCVHGSWLALHSSYFGYPSRSEIEGTSKREFNFSDSPPQLVIGMVQFMYDGEYCTAGLSDKDLMMYHINLHDFANNYRLNGLKRATTENFRMDLMIISLSSEDIITILHALWDTGYCTDHLKDDFYNFIVHEWCDSDSKILIKNICQLVEATEGQSATDVRYASILVGRLLEAKLEE